MKRGRKPEEHQARNQTIVARLNVGATLKGVSIEYGITPERVRQIARRLGYSGGRASPRWATDADKQLQELVRTGLSASLIADNLGVTKNAVIGRARRLGLALLAEKRRPPRFTVRVSPRDCVACGSVFTPKRNARFCSNLCQRQVWRVARRTASTT
jgi:GcrA cell cycle regulator